MTDHLPTRASIGVIGGSGVYSLLDDARAHTVDTPYGRPSADITVGTLAGRDVAFVPRHGTGHEFAPHHIPYRANLWALRSLGVRQVLSVSAVGSLRAPTGPGALVLPDQLVDRTSGRPSTFTTEGAGVAHVSFADPYCPHGRHAAMGGARRVGADVVDGGTLVVINGPRFSTRAESQEYQCNGWSVIGMTALPEAALARELALCYTTLALVTDLDAGVEAGSGVTHAEVLQQFADNLPRLRDWLAATLEHLPEQQQGCECSTVYDQVPAPFELP